jgi:hypothetical protein
VGSYGEKAGEERKASFSFSALLAEGVEKYLERQVPPRVNDGWAICPESRRGRTCELLLAI